MSSVKIQSSATGTANFTIAVPDGTSTDRTINLPDAAGSFVLADGSNNVAVTGDLTVDTNTLYVDSANNRVGVGTASPSAKIHSVDSNGNVLRLQRDGAFTGSWDVDIGSLSTGDFTIYDNENSKRAISIEKLTALSGLSALCIDSKGRILAATTSNIAGSNAVLHINADGVASGAGSIISECAATTTVYHVHFRNGNGGVGGINTNGSSTSYVTSSDYRLKENVTELTGAIDRVKQVPVHRFNFVADPDKTVDGFLAHEVSDVVPEAITGTKDEVDDEGNPVYQGIDQSKLVPLLTAALQEAITKIEALETRVAALEAV